MNDKDISGASRHPGSVAVKGWQFGSDPHQQGYVENNAPANGSHPSSKVDPPQHTPKVDTDGVESLPQDSDLEWNLPCIANCYCGCSDCKKPGIPLTSEQMAILASHISWSDRDDGESGQVESTSELWLVNRLVEIDGKWVNPQNISYLEPGGSEIDGSDRGSKTCIFFRGTGFDSAVWIHLPTTEVVAALHGQEVENGG